MNANCKRFWGLFWVDVSDFAAAERDFKKIADQIRPGTTHQNVEHALSALAEVNPNTHPWLLILDNADDRRGDYARFFPSVLGGSIILTSRNRGCDVHETVGSCELETISFQDSVYLLLKVANLHERYWESYWPQAETIAKLLGSHTLTLIQAGAFLSRDVRNWNEYPKLFNDNRQNLLTTSWDQAQSKYGNVYATFEVSARTLESDGSTAAKDALCLLEIFAMFHHSGFPTSILEGASKGLRYAETEGYSNGVDSISAELANLLPEFLTESRFPTLRLQAGLYYLEALSFIKQASMGDQDGVKLVSMHPLAHSWAKDRLDRRKQEQAWVMTGSIIAFSAKSDPRDAGYWDHTKWDRHARQLQSHIRSFLGNRMSCRSRSPCIIEHRQVDYVVSRLLSMFSLYEELEPFLLEVFQSFNGEPSTPQSIDLLSFYEELASAWLELGKVSSSIDLWEQIILLQEANSFHEQRLRQSKYGLASAYSHNGETSKAIAQLENILSIENGIHWSDDQERLKWQHALGREYLRNGQPERGTELLEHVVRVQQTMLVETSMERLTSEHELGRAYWDNGQAEKAIKLFEHVVRIRKTTLAESSTLRLASENVLALAYVQVNRNDEAMQLFQHVARIKRATLAPSHPSRLMTLIWLPNLYIQHKQPEMAKEVVLEIQDALRSLPKDNAQWREHGKWLAGWQQHFGIEEKPQALGECNPFLASDARPHSTSTEYEKINKPDAGSSTNDAELGREPLKSRPSWKARARRALSFEIKFL